MKSWMILVILFIAIMLFIAVDILGKFNKITAGYAEQVAGVAIINKK